jgi:hypothetical protein
MVELHRQGKTPDLFSRALWKSCKKSRLVAKQKELANEMMYFSLRSIFVHTSKGFLTCRKILHGADGFTSPPKEGVLRIFIALKNPSLLAGFEPAKLGSNYNHANHYITEDDSVPYKRHPKIRGL